MIDQCNHRVTSVQHETTEEYNLELLNLMTLLTLHIKVVLQLPGYNVISGSIFKTKQKEARE